jgi:hypothetical protein
MCVELLLQCVCAVTVLLLCFARAYVEAASHLFKCHSSSVCSSKLCLLYIFTGTTLEAWCYSAQQCLTPSYCTLL